MFSFNKTHKYSCTFAAFFFGLLVSLDSSAFNIASLRQAQDAGAFTLVDFIKSPDTIQTIKPFLDAGLKLNVIFNLLVEGGANVELADETGKTPLMWAAKAIEAVNEYAKNPSHSGKSTL